MSQTRGHNVVVVGAINVDLVVRTESLPSPGQTVTGDDIKTFGGGKGANAAVAAARAGANVVLLGAVGKDDRGHAALTELGNERIDVSRCVEVEGVPTGVALIAVDHTGENQIVVSPGANALLTPRLVERSLRAIVQPSDCVLVSTEIPSGVVLAVVRTAFELGVRCILNPAPVLENSQELLQYAPVLTPNRTELYDLVRCLGHQPTGQIDADCLLLSEVTKREVVVTLGADGVLFMPTNHEPFRFVAPSVVARDATGAGDTFNGVLASEIARGVIFEDAIRAGVAAASLSVMESGARGGMPNLNDIYSRISDVRLDVG